MTPIFLRSGPLCWASGLEVTRLWVLKHPPPWSDHLSRDTHIGRIFWSVTYKSVHILYACSCLNWDEMTENLQIPKLIFPAGGTWACQPHGPAEGGHGREASNLQGRPGGFQLKKSSRRSVSSFPLVRLASAMMSPLTCYSTWILRWRVAWWKTTGKQGETKGGRAR